MIERTEQRFHLKPARLAADTAYGSGANLNWLVKEKKIAPLIPVIDKSKREDDTFSRDDFAFDKERNVYTCPAGKTLTTTGRLVNDGETLYYTASMRDCRCCPLLASWPRPQHSNERVMSESASRCCLLTLSAFCGSAVCVYEGRAALSSSSSWQRSRRIFVGSPSSRSARRRH